MYTHNPGIRSGEAGMETTAGGPIMLVGARGMLQGLDAPESDLRTSTD